MSRCCASGWSLTDDLAADRIKGEIYDDAVDDGGEALPGPPRPDRDRQRRRADARRAQRAGEASGSASSRPRSTASAELNFTFGQRYVVVNIPAAVAEAVDGDKVQHRYVVVVGKVDRPSPTLTTTDQRRQPQPDLDGAAVDHEEGHHHPDAQGSGLRQRACACACSTRNGSEIDPKSVDWKSDRSPNFTIRQDSGAGNALGALRIDMPNPHSVYMHDTNHKEFFSADYRFHSSGCARVAEVRDLATWLLADNPGWGRKRARRRDRHRPDAQTVRLTHKVPVAWVYFTGWVTRDDVVHFRDDVYGHDEPMPPCGGRAAVAAADPDRGARLGLRAAKRRDQAGDQAGVVPGSAGDPAACPDRGTCRSGRCRRLHEIPQPRLLEQRIGHVAEFAHALLVARPRQQHAVEAGARQRDQRIDHLLLGADQRQAAPALDERLLQRLDAAPAERCAG